MDEKPSKNNGKSFWSKNIKQGSKFSNRTLVIFILSLGIVGTYILTQTDALPRKSSKGTPSVSLYINPSSQNVTKGQNFTVAVWLDALTNPVNAVQANLSYDPSQLNFVNIDGTASAFEIEAQAVGSNGTVNIARGHIGTLTGKQFVANVTFTPIAGKNAEIKFTSGSAIARATDNVDILANTIGGKYRIN